MATLTETAYLARKSVNIGIIVFVFIIILRVIFNVFIGLKDRFFPPAPPPPTLAFGRLPQINAQNNIATPSALTYTLETIDPDLPKLPPTMKVYFMPKVGPSFNSFDKMKSQAVKTGFTGIPQKINGTVWRFFDATNSLRLLDIDELSLNFRLTYNYFSDPSVFADKNFNSTEGIVSEAQSFFPDLKAATPSAVFLKSDSGVLVPTTVLANADAVGITLNRADIGEIPVISPDFRQGLVSILFSGSSDGKKRVLEARYFYSPIDLENWATYPLIKSSEAWDKLISGKAIFTSLPNPVPTNISIRKIYLAYLDPYPAQSYLQPVLIFSDEKGFIAAVPIIIAEWSE